MNETQLRELHGHLAEAAHALHKAWEVAVASGESARNVYDELASDVAALQYAAYDKLHPTFTPQAEAYATSIHEPRDESR
jgi:hypothetical protein